LRKIDTQDFRRATRDTPREVNRRIILTLLREQGPTSRADLARAMGIPRGMITSLVNELLADELVVEGATTQTKRGRRPTLLHLRSHDRLAVGVDVLAVHTVVRICDFGGATLEERVIPTPEAPEDFVTQVAMSVAELVEKHADRGQCEGVGIVVPGMVDTRSGRVLNAPALAWRDVDLEEVMAEAVGLPVHVERDAVACALERMWLGDRPEKGARDFVYLLVSEGVGLGIMVNGQPVRGRHYTAGEFGHMPLDLEGPPCSCGARGCLEAFASDPATIARYLHRELTGRDAAKAALSGIPTVPKLVEMAKAGDVKALAALDTTARYVGVGIATIINVLDPAWIILGGDITGAWELLEPTVRAQIEDRTLTESAATTPIGIDPDHVETRLRGAAALVVADAFAAPQVA
jgi:predicted NBD/HSP70 family sugar kinase